ncbi:hypothetical protein [Clostridium senegalense]|uniref:hypothetical protein n=1 Tax=Clostridium senegalense TaxID=1465809 RepID=UPI0002FB3277|nr:hypothetical protein [Clostridium senegalense]
MTLKDIVMMQYNEVKYNRTKDTEIVVKTTIDKIEKKDEKIIIKSIEDYNIIRGNFEFERYDIEQIESLKKGDNILIKGTFKKINNGFLGLVIYMEDCKIESF